MQQENYFYKMGTWLTVYGSLFLCLYFELSVITNIIISILWALHIVLALLVGSNIYKMANAELFYMKHLVNEIDKNLEEDPDHYKFKTGAVITDAISLGFNIILLSYYDYVALLTAHVILACLGYTHMYLSTIIAGNVERINEETNQSIKEFFE